MSTLITKPRGAGSTSLLPHPHLKVFQAATELGVLDLGVTAYLQAELTIAQH